MLLISVDGLHQSDLRWWVRHHPPAPSRGSRDAGTEYADAITPVPSDSFPGMVAQVTGGDPRTTGIYYDDSYNRRLLPPGSACTPGQTTGLGTEVNFAENIDRNLNSIDAGFGIPNLYPGLPGSVLAPARRRPAIEAGMIDPAQLPIDPATCKPVYPHQYLRVNTIFQVAHDAGLRTAWSDKHPAYEMLGGHAGTGIDDLFAPEINSSTTDPACRPARPDWTTNNRDTQFYDGIKVRAVLNEIDGHDHSGTAHVGVPAIFGMNFQSVSTAEKLPTSPIGGVEPAGRLRPPRRPLGAGAGAAGRARLRRPPGRPDGRRARPSRPARPRPRDRVGQARPVADRDVGARSASTTATSIDALERRVAGPRRHGQPGRVRDRRRRHVHLARRPLGARAAVRPPFLLALLPARLGARRHRLRGQPDRVHRLRTARGAVRAGFFGVPRGDARVPDLVGIVQHGVVYTGGTGKIAEHGGDDPQDRHVPLLVYGARSFADRGRQPMMVGATGSL